MSRLLPWVVRAAWAILPFVAGPAFSDALDGWSETPRSVASVGLWAVWGAVVIATLVPHPVCLTIVRIAAPAGALASTLAAAAGHGAVPLVLWLLLLGLVFAPETGRWYVNGPAYPNERRMLLRPPGLLLVGPIPVAWAVVVGAPTAGVLLLADAQWVIGGVVLVAGAALAFLLARSLHVLSRRWVVFVPAGVVLHDDLALADPVLFRRGSVRGLGPAPAETDALDLTRGALGLALQLDLTEEASLALAQPGNRAGRSEQATSLLFTPTRPGAVLAEAQVRRLA